MKFTDCGSSDKMGHALGLFHRMWQSVRARARLYVGVEPGEVRLGCLLCFADVLQRGDAEQHGIFVLKNNGFGTLNRQQIQDAMVITRSSAASLGHGWVYYIKFWRISSGQVPAAMVRATELAASAFETWRATKMRLDIPAGSARFQLIRGRKKWKAQFRLKVGNDAKFTTFTLGSAWGTEVEAASVLREFFGVGFTPGVFVMPTYPSKGAAKDACGQAIKVVADRR